MLVNIELIMLLLITLRFLAHFFFEYIKLDMIFMLSQVKRDDSRLLFATKLF